jgi:flagellar motility protein MotE (MotC chaperone)
MTRMDLYTMYLPRLARWEAELTADDLTRGVDARTLAADFERLTRAVDRIATVAETASDLAERERTAALDAVRGERIAVLEAVEKERIALLEAVRKERIATLREVEAMAQRLGDRSGPPWHDAVRADLKGLVKSVEEMRKRLIADAFENLDGVVDHAFFRLVELLLICAGLVGLGLALRLFFLRRRRRGRDVA